MQPQISRRALFSAGAAAAGASVLGPAAGAAPRRKNEPFLYCLNTSTVRGQKLSPPEQVDLAARAGYDALEPWIGDLEQWAKGGGSLKDLGARIKDRGLTVESAIGFFEWIVDDDARRAAALENAKRSMDIVAQIGGFRVAAPPSGAQQVSGLDLNRAAERYRALLELGDRMGVVPQAEVWGFSKTLTRLSEATFVAIQADHPKACVLPDVYHLYKGGSGIEGLRLVANGGMFVMHVNDYPAAPPRETINDSARVYPGDGVAPLDRIFRILNDAGYRGALSLEVFNQTYWMQEPLTVLKTGLEKTRAAVRKALG